MKNLTKKLLTVIVAVLLVMTSFVSEVSAFSDADKTTVTVQGLQSGDVVTLYKVVKATYNSSGGHDGYESTSDKVVSSKEEVTLTEKSPVSGTEAKKLVVLASDLDVNKDGYVDAEYTKDNVTYTVDPIYSGGIVYNWEEPTQEQIFLVTKEKAWTSTSYTATAGSEGYVQFDVEAGQYIGIITPAGTKTYNPVVLSAGIIGYDIYELQDVNHSASADSYKLKNGGFTSAAPSPTDYFKYENAKLSADGTTVVFENAVSLTGGTDPNTFTVTFGAGDSYVPMYKKVGTTKENRLIADDLNIAPRAEDEKYKWYGTTAAPKSTEPGIEKTLETNHVESENKVPVVAVNEYGDPYSPDAATNTLHYISSDYTLALYMKALSGEEFRQVAGSDPAKYELIPAGETGTVVNKDTVLAAMRTTDPKKALQVSTTGEKQYNAGQGELAHYTLTPTIPQYPLNSINKTLIVADKMAKGLDYVEGSLQIKFLQGYEVERVQNLTDNADGLRYDYYVYEPSGTWNTEGGAVGVKDGEGTWYKDANNEWKELNQPLPEIQNGTHMYTKKLFAKLAEKSALGNGNTNDFQVNFIYDNLPGTEGDKKAPVLEYDAALTADAVSGIEGNINVAKFFFAKDSYDGSTHETFTEPSGNKYRKREDAKKVYTYEMRFRKANDEPEYVGVETGATHYVLLKKDAVLSSIDALGLTTEDANNLKAEVEEVYASLVLCQAEVKLLDGTKDAYYVVETLPTVSNANVKFANPETKTVKFNDNFAVLKDAEYGIYSDANATHLVTKVKTNEKGIAITTNIAGTDENEQPLQYWIKELVAPTGYTVDSRIYGPYEPNWTSATIETTEETEQFVYTIKPTEAIKTDGSNAGLKAAGTTTVLPNVYSSDGTIAGVSNSAAAVANQVGWLVGDGTTDLRELDTYKESEWHYYEYADTNGNIVHHEMHHKTNGTVIKNVYRAYLKEATTTSTSGSATYYNNNAGMIYLQTFKDTKSSELPSTGGIGTYLFTIAGVAIIATAAFMLIFRKKEGHNH